MLNIIKKLGLKRLEPFSSLDADGNMKYRLNDVAKLQSDRNSMIDVLIEDVLMDEAYCRCKGFPTYESYTTHYGVAGIEEYASYCGKVAVIERVTHMSWDTDRN